MGDNGTMGTRRPQLSDTITRLDEMIDGLATAIPGAVSDSIQASLGPVFATALKDAIKDAVRESFEELRAESVKAEPPAAPPIPAASEPAAPSKPSVWARVKELVGQMKAWAKEKAAPVVAKATLGWAVVKLVGGATMHSRTATVLTAVAGTLAGFVGFAIGPITAAVLLGLMTGAITATAIWATPMAAFLVAFREE